MNKVFYQKHFSIDLYLLLSFYFFCFVTTVPTQCLSLVCLVYVFTLVSQFLFFSCFLLIPLLSISAVSHHAPIDLFQIASHLRWFPLPYPATLLTHLYFIGTHKPLSLCHSAELCILFFFFNLGSLNNAMA